MDRKGEKHRKYTVEEKLFILRDREKSNLSRAEVAAKYKISASTIRDRIRQYEDDGVEGLSRRNPGKPYGKYTLEFRTAVIQAMMENDWYYTETAKQYGINVNAIRKCHISPK